MKPREDSEVPVYTLLSPASFQLPVTATLPLVSLRAQSHSLAAAWVPDHQLRPCDVASCGHQRFRILRTEPALPGLSLSLIGHEYSKSPAALEFIGSRFAPLTLALWNSCYFLVCGSFLLLILFSRNISASSHCKALVILVWSQTSPPRHLREVVPLLVSGPSLFYLLPSSCQKLFCY